MFTSQFPGWRLSHSRSIETDMRSMSSMKSTTHLTRRTRETIITRVCFKDGGGGRGGEWNREKEKERSFVARRLLRGVSCIHDTRDRFLVRAYDEASIDDHNENDKEDEFVDCDSDYAYKELQQRIDEVRGMGMKKNNRNNRKKRQDKDEPDKNVRLGMFSKKNRRKKKRFTRSFIYSDSEVDYILHEIENENENEIHSIPPSLLFEQLLGDEAFIENVNKDIRENENEHENDASYDGGFILRDHQKFTPKKREYIKQIEDLLKDKEDHHESHSELSENDSPELDNFEEFDNNIAACEWSEEVKYDYINRFYNLYVQTDVKEDAKEDVQEDEQVYKKKMYFALMIKSTDVFYTVSQTSQDEKNERACVPIFDDENAAIRFMKTLQDTHKQFMTRSKVRRPQFPLEAKRINYLPFMKSCYATGLDVLLIRVDTEDMFQKIDAHRDCSPVMRGLLDHLYWLDSLPEALSFWIL